MAVVVIEGITDYAVISDAVIMWRMEILSKKFSVKCWLSQQIVKAWKRQVRKQTNYLYKIRKSMCFFGSSIQSQAQTYNGCLLAAEMSHVHRAAPLRNSRSYILLVLLSREEKVRSGDQRFSDLIRWVHFNPGEEIIDTNDETNTEDLEEYFWLFYCSQPQQTRSVFFFSLTHPQRSQDTN